MMWQIFRWKWRISAKGGEEWRGNDNEKRIHKTFPSSKSLRGISLDVIYRLLERSRYFDHVLFFIHLLSLSLSLSFPSYFIYPSIFPTVLTNMFSRNAIQQYKSNIHSRINKVSPWTHSVPIFYGTKENTSAIFYDRIPPRPSLRAVRLRT